MSFYPNNDANASARPMSVNVASVMTQVYMWMTLGLVIAAGTAYLTANIIYNLALTGTGGGVVPYLPLLFMIVYLVMAFAMWPVVLRSSPTVGTLFYLAFTAVTGIALSYVLFAYTTSTIFAAFLVTAGTFGITSFIGYTTKRDLSGMGGILMMALIGIILASIANIFIGSSGLDMIINYIAVLVFVGLAAYKTQWIKNYATNAAASGNPEMIQKVSIIGAFSLYITFVNLFLTILRIMGGGRGGRR